MPAWLNGWLSKVVGSLRAPSCLEDESRQPHQIQVNRVWQLFGGRLNSYSNIYIIEMYIYKKSRQAKKKLAWLSFSSKDPTSKQACLTGRLWQSGADGTQIGYKFLFMACWFRTVQLSLPFGEWLSWTTLVFLMASVQLWERSHNPLHLQVRSTYM